MKALPIRFRLTLWYGAMFAAAAALLSISGYLMLRQSLAATEYHEMQERAEDVRLLLDQLGPHASLDFLQQRFAEIYAVKDDGKYLQVIDENGNWLFRSRRMIAAGLEPATPNELPPQGTILEFQQGTRYVRALSYPIRANGHAYSVQTGIALNKSMVLLDLFRRRLLLLTPAVLILALLGGHIMSRKALAPVAAIATEARRINDRNLDVRLPVGTTRDEISHLSETLNQMLERVECGVRSIREFTANAAHELRTPLALIRTEVEVALSSRRAAEEYRGACEQVQLEAVRMTGLIDSLLMLARVDAGTESFQFETIEANQLIRQIEDAWKTATRVALLDFQVHTDDSPLFISADRNALYRLLTILLDNATRYTPPGGSITLQASKNGDQVGFAVRDTGIGIAQEHQSRIFERFYRVERRRSGVSGGSGLGLALAKWIAEKHGTSIILESEVERGSRFWFSIPAVEEPLRSQIVSHQTRKIPT